MKKILITGGTVFVSWFAAKYFRDRYEVYVLNRNTREQVPGVRLIEGDRHAIGDKLKKYRFDAVLDITAYSGRDISDLLDALGEFEDYILISSSAVYPEGVEQPLSESHIIGPNSVWGKYGTDKIDAETVLHSRVPTAYILRPPYLYGPGNNVYREAFCFDCARDNRKFCLPGDGSMPLQFFHVEDLCRFMEILLEEKPGQRIFNVGNPKTVTIRKWVELCYQTVGKESRFVSISETIEQRNYFPFYKYAYNLDVNSQKMLMPSTKSLESGLCETWEWYQEHEDMVRKKPLIAYIDEKL